MSIEQIFVPEELTQRINAAAEVLLREFKSDEGWETFLMEHANYKAKRKARSTHVEVKVESELPFSLLDIMQSIGNEKRGVVQDKLKVFSNRTWIDYIRYRSVPQDLSP